MANALEAGIAAFADPLGCCDRVAGFSTKGYALLGLPLRFLRMRRKTRHAAISAPAMAQPTPMPAAAPFDTPLEEEEDPGLELGDAPGWPSALASLLEFVLAVGRLILAPEDAGDAFAARRVVALEVCGTLELLSELVVFMVEVTSRSFWVVFSSITMSLLGPGIAGGCTLNV